MGKSIGVQFEERAYRWRWCDAMHAIRIFGGMVSSHHLDLFEWARANVERSRLPNGPVWSDFATSRGRLTFSGLRLAHAILQAEFASPPNPFLQQAGFLLESTGYLDFHHDNLRLLERKDEAGRDFTPSTYAGRLAQGLSILFAETQNYNFKALIAELPEAQPFLAGKKEKAADFVFEAASGQRMILESKGSFSMPENDPSGVKAVLRGALLDQVGPWMTRLEPAADKGFAVLSCIRKTSDTTPSALIYVDPPAGDIGSDAFPVPPSRVRRQNYAAWLDVMGLPGPAKRLRGNAEAPAGTYRFLVSREGPVELAFLDEPTFAPHCWYYWPGIDVQALKAISSAIQGDEGELLRYGKDERYPFEEGSASVDRPYNGSLMRDGTYLGEPYPFSFFPAEFQL